MEKEARDLVHKLVYQPRDEGINRLIQMRDEAYDSALRFYEETLRGIEPKYHSQFIMLGETGKATQEFLDYIENNEQAQKACEKIMEVQANSLRGVAKALMRECDKRLEKLAKESDVTFIRRKK